MPVVYKRVCIFPINIVLWDQICMILPVGRWNKARCCMLCQLNSINSEYKSNEISAGYISSLTVMLWFCLALHTCNMLRFFFILENLYKSLTLLLHSYSYVLWFSSHKIVVFFSYVDVYVCIQWSAKDFFFSFWLKFLFYTE